MGFNQRQGILDLLQALEYGTKKEEKEIIYALLKTARRGELSDVADKLLRSPGFEETFFIVMEQVEPFARMIGEIYEFLNDMSTTATRRASKFLVSKEGAEARFEFDLDNFPVEFFRTLTAERITESQVELRLPDMTSDHPADDELSPLTAWRPVDPVWDNDFYDNGFHRALSYARSILRDAGHLSAAEQIVEPIMDRLAAICVFAADLMEGDDRNRLFQRENVRWRGDEPTKFGYIMQVAPRTHRVTADSAAVLRRPVRRFRDDTPEPLVNAIWRTLHGFAESIYTWHNPDLHRDDGDWLSDRLKQPFDAITPEIYLAFLRQLADSYRTRLDEVAPVIAAESHEQMVERLLQFLALPFWSARWYLYELWTVVLVLRTAQHRWPVELLGLSANADGTAEWILPGGTARDPVASIGERGQVACWVQRKTYHPGTGAGLEPDLRLISQLPPYHDIAIVENKDRRTLRRRKLSEILDRYVGGTYADVVWMVNYEEFPATAPALAQRWPERQVHFASHFRPGEIPAAFEPSLISAMAPRMEDRPASTASELTATLTWTSVSRDLDLHAWIVLDGKLSHIYYGNPGSLESPPYAQLSDDVRAGPGSETLKVRATSYSLLVLAVYAYSGEGTLAQAGAALSVTGGEPEFTLLAPPGDGRWWNALTIQDGGLHIEAPGTLSDERPTVPDGRTQS